MPVSPSTTVFDGLRIFFGPTADRAFATRAKAAGLRNTGLGLLLKFGTIFGPLLTVIQGGMMIWAFYRLCRRLDQEHPLFKETLVARLREARRIGIIRAERLAGGLKALGQKA